MALGVPIYDPEAHFRDVEYQAFGTDKAAGEDNDR
jgi:hypothetical protein